jgi:hypothetical protein
VKTVKIVPSVCKVSDAKWSGYVVMRLPTFDEKFDYIESLNVEMGKDGEVEGVSTMDRIKQIRKLVSASQKHYSEVCLENKETGEKVSSFDEMQYVDDLHAVMAEIAGKLVDGFKVGNG